MYPVPEGTQGRGGGGAQGTQALWKGGSQHSLRLQGWVKPTACLSPTVGGGQVVLPWAPTHWHRDREPCA